MANQLIPAAGLEPSIPKDLTPDQRFALWADLMDASEQILLAGLSKQIGPEGNLQEAYRKWYLNQREEHDRNIRHQAESLYQRGVRHGC